MHAKALRNELLSVAIPQMHHSRRTALVWAVSSALNGAALTVTELRRGIGAGAYEKHRIKRADRLMSNRHLYDERLALNTQLARRVTLTT